MSKKTCISCNKVFDEKSFYNDRNPIIDSEHFGICKKCVRNFVKTDNTNTLWVTLQTMNIPYMSDYWDKALESNQEPIGNYLKNMNSLSQLRDLTFLNGEGFTNSNAGSLESRISYEVSENDKMNWGIDLPDNKIYKLNNRYNDLLKDLNKKEADLISTERSSLRHISFLDVQIEEAMINNETDSVSKWNKTRSDLMKEVGVSPEQLNKSNISANTIGERIAKYEEEQPIPYNKKYEDKSIIRAVKDYLIPSLRQTAGIATEDDINKLNEGIENVLGSDSGDK